MGGQDKLLQGRWALVTGATGGIGRAISLAFAEHGANLWISGRNEEKLKDTAEDAKALGAAEVIILKVDLAASKAVDELAAKVTDKIDILVNNAGLAVEAAAMKGDPDQWEEKMMQLDLLVPMRLTRRIAPAISKRQAGGHIINISSVAGIEALPGIGGYNAAKFGLTGWSKSIQQELKEHNVRVITIYPGYVASEMTADAPVSQDKMIRPEDIAQAALLPFRMSPYACPTDIVVRPAQKLSRGA
ncbi:NAD(P)-binding protein [Coccomyxa subellipsoidea C-169]|uniref:NAD(P)-binding protein n=1 Tax=Coccomyxa subellipsoidea (strain C-169) TaxID=574566 RepID=I0YTY3_COCSC|nr:NAD(P)-binding protein [Coccomyxa subellipsoidea C-169]EIE21852.1 NAD(P)-binding protein [Coccomyxa subellipsoidea C-169]|eukprot:XP_005646396.1 NAD(P)-binding protein [Coccomyxa subellipsoidea C-169]